MYSMEQFLPLVINEHLNELVSYLTSWWTKIRSIGIKPAAFTTTH